MVNGSEKIGPYDPNTGKLSIDETDPSFDSLIANEIAIGSTIIETEDVDSARPNGKSIYSISPEEKAAVETMVNQNRYDPNIKTEFDIDDMQPTIVMEEVADWAIKNPFSEELYAATQSTLLTGRITEIRRQDPEKFMNELRADAKAIRKKQLVVNAYNPALYKEFRKNLYEDGFENALKDSAALMYKKINNESIENYEMSNDK